MKVKSLQIIFILFSACFINAQVIVSNSITGTNPNTSNPYAIGQTTDPDITSPGIGRGIGITGSNANNRYNANGWSATFDSDDYFEVIVNPNAGVVMNFTTFDFTLQNSSTGSNTIELRSSVDGFNAPIGSPATALSPGAINSIDLSAFTNITTPITFRIYGYGASAGGGTLSVNDFSLNGTAVSSTMPISLISFEVKNNGERNLLKWATVAEINNSHFIIEYSEDGFEFEEIGRVRGKGNSTRYVAYDFSHDIINSGTHYYRLSQYDFDGKFETFKVKSVTSGILNEAIRIYPTISNHCVNITGFHEGKEVQIYDMTGRLMCTLPIADQTINLSNLNNGYYLIVAENTTHKIVKN